LYTRSKCLYVFLTAALLATSAFGQDAGQAPAAAPAAAPPPWSVGAIDFSGVIDGYYTFNFNHPASGINGLYNFDTQANQFSLSMAKLSMSHSADPIGFQVDFGFGKTFDIVNGGEPALGTKNIEQAFVSWKPQGKDSGFQMDFGKFVTSAGAEVIESYPNWNYSRSILFAWAIPFYHFGFRATETKGHFTGGFQLVNGWNNVEDSNSGKTMGFVGNLTSSKVTWLNNYYTGPENPGTNTGWRNLYDTTVLFTPTDKFNAYFNFDYGQNKSGTGLDEETDKWYGVAGAAKFQLNDQNAITPRLEWFKDKNGFSTGTAQSLKEFTFTYEYRWMQGLLTRIEYRRDWSDQPYFERGSTGSNDHQDTFALGVVAFFGPH
jgi:Putative beta-barrel porin-2, OmpL-like. bbp2